ncbi:hypothetical protein [Aquamicrobium ahrensii]|uniref:DUF3311 domain-containing protein n=1 Tax=Aquamicrobium ahrensii TaxID=469551 RepID=A0ABV2KJ52_9HYPH
MPSAPGAGKEERAEREDIALLAPFFGGVLLMPPLLNLFGGLLSPLGVPVEILYLFGVWVLVIVGAVLLSRRRQFHVVTPEPTTQTRTPLPTDPAGDS